MTAVQQKNSDLIWSLDGFSRQEMAKRFVTRFESRLCVYSPTVRQIYTNYTLEFPGGQSNRMVVLPNPYAFHDTFNSIDHEAIRDTGMFIVPGALIKKSGLFLVVKYKNQSIKAAPIPIRQALKRMVRNGTEKDPFLPILIKGDLREFNSNTPCLHLHRIKLPDLCQCSDFEKTAIKKAIFKKMSDLYDAADEIAAGF